jgi:hypothetical protein
MATAARIKTIPPVILKHPVRFIIDLTTSMLNLLSSSM